MLTCAGWGMAHSSRQRHGHMEGRAFPDYAATLDPDASLHRFYQRASDIESQPCSSNRAMQISLEPDEALEEMALLMRRNAQALIFHTDEHTWGRLGGLSRYEGEGRTGLRVFQGIRTEIEQDLTQGTWISLDKEVRLYVHRDFTLFSSQLGSEKLNHTVQELCDRHSLDLKMLALGFQMT